MVRAVFSCILILLAFTSLVFWVFTPCAGVESFVYRSGFQSGVCYLGIDLRGGTRLVAYIDEDHFTLICTSRKPPSRRSFHEFRLGSLVIRQSQVPKGRPAGSRSTFEGPMWLPAVFLLIYPTVVFARRPLRRYARSLRNQCIWCGYSLRGTLAHRCPECGRGEAQQPAMPFRSLRARGLRWLGRGAAMGALAPALAFALQLAFPNCDTLAPSGTLGGVLCLGMKFGARWGLYLLVVNATLFGVLFLVGAVVAIVLRQDVQLRRAACRSDE